jgi:phosphoribosylformimino-5-aminoimidazole carboxamide ribotide isomerase
LEKKVGKEKLIVDISCRKREDGWVVAMNGWKTLTDMWVTKGQSFSLYFICMNVELTM